MKTELTGLIRFRPQKRWFKAPLLVVQVQLRTFGYEFGPAGLDMGRDVDHTWWRDAKIEDVLVLNVARDLELKNV